jgi:hypothetical protein
MFTQCYAARSPVHSILPIIDFLPRRERGNSKARDCIVPQKAAILVSRTLQRVD